MEALFLKNLMMVIISSLMRMRVYLLIMEENFLILLMKNP